MFSHHDLEKIQHALSEAKEKNDFGVLERFLEEQKEQTDSQYICDITWSVDDIKTIRADWSDEQCADAAGFVAKGLQDRSTEEGWQILETLLWCKERDEEESAA